MGVLLPTPIIALFMQKSIIAFGNYTQRGREASTARGRMIRKRESSDRLVSRVAEAFEIAFRAMRLARLADLAPVPDQLVRKQNPFFSRNNFHQVLFDFLGIGIS